jgi:hypothetical protein
MTKHKPEHTTLGEIVDNLASNNHWVDVLGIDLNGLDDADYLAGHKNDRYLVSWPEHVSVPRFNGDANYQPDDND